MLPSLRLIILILVACPVFLAGALFDPLQGAGVLYCLFLLVYAAVDLLILPRKSQITIHRLVPERISLCSPAMVVVELENRTRRRVKVLLAEDLPEGLEANPPYCWRLLDPDDRQQVKYRLLAGRRGKFQLGPMDIRILPSMGLFYRQFRLDIPAEIQVFPNLVNLKKYDLLLRKGLTREQGLARLRQLGQGSEFESLRTYAQGDEMSRIDWKATAKRSQLIVKNFQPERQQSVLVAIDAGRATAGEFHGTSRLDYLVNASLMLAYVTLRQGDWFSLVAFSDRIHSYLPPVRGLKNVDRVARALYELEPRLTESDYGAACRFLGLRGRKRSLICVMTDVIDRQASDVILSHMAQFARRHLPLAVTLANPEVKAIADQPLSETPDPYMKAVALDVLAARQEALVCMRRSGVDVLDVNPEELTPELISRYLQIKATRRL